MELAYRKLSLPAIVEKAAVEDQLFLTRFAKQGNQNQVISKFKVVPNEGRNKYNPFHILRIREPPIDNNDGNNDDNNDGDNDDNTDNDSNNSTPPQQLLECHIVGEILYTILDTYGDWVPDGEFNDDLMFSTQSPSKAAHQIRLKVPDSLINSLQIIDDSVKDAFSTNNMPISTFYGTILNGNEVITRNKLLMHRKEWKRLQDERRDDSDEFQGNFYSLFG
jgi:hypothetical protein